MTKQDLVEAVYKKVGCSKKIAAEVLNAIINEIIGSLKKGKNVVLTGFGTFMVTKRKARTGRNPQTGAAIKIPARNVSRFKPGSELKKAVK